MADKRGQAGAAVLLTIIVGLIIVFILLMPPSERAELLGEKGGAPAGGEITAPEEVPAKTAVKEVFLRETPGRLSYLKEEEIEKLLPSFRIFTQSQSQLLAERDFLSVKRTLFSSQEEKINFQLDEPVLVEEALLSFGIEASQGNLIVILNQQEILNREISQLAPLKLPRSLLGKENTLIIQVSSPGIAFWRTNQYQLKNLKLVGEIKDLSAQQGRNLFHISADEARNIEEASLRFSLSCAPEAKGELEIKLNGEEIFSGQPENCEDLFRYALPAEKIQAGDNWLSFKVEEGDYEVSHLAVKIELKSPAYPMYTFSVGKDYFTRVIEEADCGEIDGFCPSDCDEDFDKDCCFEKYVTASYWCDAPTSRAEERCVGSVGKADCSLCPSGYEDEEGQPPEVCEERCGDDTDDICPAGCSVQYDKDCCFKQAADQFWCQDLPSSGIDFTCVEAVSSGQCEVCPSGYEGEETSPSCPAKIEEGEEKLKEIYNVILTLSFADEEKKEAEIYVNGHKIAFDTYNAEFSRDITAHIQPWTNSIKIVPKNSFDVREIKVELKS